MKDTDGITGVIRKRPVAEYCTCGHLLTWTFSSLYGSCILKTVVVFRKYIVKSERNMLSNGSGNIYVMYVCL